MIFDYLYGLKFRTYEDDLEKGRQHKEQESNSFETSSSLESIEQVKPTSKGPA